jgi:ferredoxin
MALKGLVFSAQAEDGSLRYQAAPWVVGIYEFQVSRMSEGFVEDVDAYWSTVKPSEPVETISQMRTIPVGESITSHLEAMPYEQVDALLDAHDRFAVAPCICRRHAKLEGRGCDAPEESCLFFGDFADYYVRTGRGRRIDRAEVEVILARADEANLVLQPTNSREIAIICCCCDCCCGILGGLKRHPKPAEAIVNAFRASLDPDLCLGCFSCLDRCQMDALAEVGDHVALDGDRCIGCGLCTTTCPSGALTLVRKPDETPRAMPATMQDTWRTIAQQRVGIKR